MFIYKSIQFSMDIPSFNQTRLGDGKCENMNKLLAN
jgi:hypothetical protein